MPGAKDPCADLYLDLLKKCLAFSLWPQTLYMPFDLALEHPPKEVAEFAEGLRKIGYCLTKEFPYRPEIPEEGAAIPYLAHTMIGLCRLDNFQLCIERVIEDDIPGDIIETGVWRGGACILARGVLKAHGIKNRKIWLADSFQGLPPPNVEKYPIDQGDNHYLNPFFRVTVEEVKNHFRRFGLLDDQVCFLEGWFKNTLPRAPIERLAVLRLDGDLYESTMDALRALYGKLSLHGYVIIDDYDGKGCRQAVTDFRKATGIDDPVLPIDSHGVYWRRGR